MPEFDVEAFVAGLERMGVKLTCVPLADGKVRINRWRMLNAGDSVFVRQSRSARSAGCSGAGSPCRNRNSETYLRQEMSTGCDACFNHPVCPPVNLILATQSVGSLHSENDIHWKLDC